MTLTVDAQEFREIASKEKKINYNGYEIETTFNPRSRISRAIVKRNGRTLINLHYGWFLDDATKVGMFPVLGGNTKQLIVEQYTGGAHCCSFFWIYDLGKTPHLLFSNENYGFESGNGLNLIDLDHDGRFELEQGILTFDYFHVSHVFSVFPSVIFSYDERTRKYRPANHRFSDYLLRDIDEDTNKVRKLRPGLDVENPIARQEYFSAVLQVMLKYLYSGKTKDAWSFYQNWYQLDDRREIAADVRKELRHSRIYRSLQGSYKRKS